MNRTLRGFTLIELLTVIAIVAILAALIFPVYQQSRVTGFKNSDISNMNSIRTSLQLYRTDQGAYPPALLGYVQVYQRGPQTGDLIPANQLQGALFPRRIESLDTFKPAYNNQNPGTITNGPNVPPLPPGARLLTAAVWPNRDPSLAPGQNPCSIQALGPGNVVLRLNPANPSVPLQAMYYGISGYDVAPDRVAPGQAGAAAGASVMALRYSLFWSGWGIGSNLGGPGACGTAGSALDDPRQLGYTLPPEDTIVTWNSFFREYRDGIPPNTRGDIVLFLGGGARFYDSRDIWERSYRAEP
ncbi:MAG: type II secretion system protein [Fimbriimonadaceae bacterium]